MRHILVKRRRSADQIYAQLKAGNTKTWCTLAKKYSQDPSSKNNCGKLTVNKGQTSRSSTRSRSPRRRTSIHEPVNNAQYGWFVIKPVSGVHPRTTTPEKQVSATIRSS